MTEEVKTAPEQEVPAKDNEPTFTELEQAALEKGWKPKEEYEGDPTRWRSAETFLALEEPIKRIEGQSKEIKQMRQALQDLAKHNTKVEQAAYSRALKALQEQKRAAFVEGEHEKFFQLEEQIDEVKQQKDEAERIAQQSVQQPQGVNPAFEAWVDRNKWYTNDTELRKKADKLGLGYHASGDSPEEVLKSVEADIKRLYPDKFKSPGANRAAAVEAPTRSGRAPSSKEDELSTDEERIMKTFVAQGHITEKEYRAQLKLIKQKG